jgi:hypothetical protein
MPDFASLVLSIDPTTLAVLTFFGIGLATLADKINDRDWPTVLKISICVGGTAALALTVPHVTVLQGAVIGMAASGTLTGLSFIGKKSSLPSDLVIPPMTDKPVVTSIES